MNVNRVFTASSTTKVGQGTDPESWISACCRDMRQRAESGRPFSASDYLSEGLSDSVCIDIIYNEFVLRSELDAALDPADFIRRYPAHSAGLYRQLTFDSAFTHIHQPSHCLTRPHRPVPTQIGKFIVVAQLPSGGQADVFLAVHPELQQEVVIKVAASHVVGGDREILKEGQILASLEHPSIAQVLDVGFHDERPFLVSRYIRGGTLDEHLHHSSLSIQEKCRLVALVARGLSEAHRLGILHLDVKPRNIVVDERGAPHLIDFGLATIRQAYHWEELEQGTLRGTLPFMPPEQAAGNGIEMDRRSDIFSLGAVLYFLVTGHSPYPQTELASLLLQVRSGSWSSGPLEAPAVPTRVREMIRRAMHPEMKHRFSTAVELAQALEQFASQPAQNIVSRRRRRAALFGGSAGVLGLSLAGLLMLNPGGVNASRLPPEVHVQVLREGHFHSVTECAPVTTGEHVRVEANVPPQHHAALFVLATDGKFRLLKSASPQAHMSRFQYPDSEGRAAPLVGDAGTELVVLCMRRRGPIETDELNRCFGEHVLPSVPELTVIGSNRYATEIVQSQRDLGAPVTVESPEMVVKLKLERFREALNRQVDQFQAFAFCHVD